MKFLPWLAALLLCAPNLFAQKKAPVIPPTVEVEAGIEFGNVDGHALLLDVYRPKKRAEGAKLPVVLWVHGGGWKKGSRTRVKGLWLCEHDYAVVSIDYRLTDVAQWPAQIDDCYAAVRWVRNNAERYGFDPERIGAFGSSAGGHLVAIMGTRPFPGDEKVSSKVQAVCDWFGPSELMTMPPNNLGNGLTFNQVANSNGAKLLGARVREVPDKARDASALDHVTADDAPFLIMHGSEDPGVPLSQSEKLHQRLKSAGADSTLSVLKGAAHGGPAFNTKEVQDEVRAFFDRTLTAP